MEVQVVQMEEFLLQKMQHLGQMEPPVQDLHLGELVQVIQVVDLVVISDLIIWVVSLWNKLLGLMVRLH